MVAEGQVAYCSAVEGVEEVMRQELEYFRAQWSGWLVSEVHR